MEERKRECRNCAWVTQCELLDGSTTLVCDADPALLRQVEPDGLCEWHGFGFEIDEEPNV